MTFSILAKDPNTKEIGIAIATYSLAVGATCPYFIKGKAVITSQSSTNPKIGQRIKKLIENKKDPENAFNSSIKEDPFYNFRQVALLTFENKPLVFTGNEVKKYCGSVIGNNCIAIGNYLAGKNVLDSMIENFENKNNNMPLGEKLILSLLSAKKSGGQKSLEGNQLPERSACIIVSSIEELFPVNLRIDSSSNPISDISDLYSEYLGMHNYYLKRASNPKDLPPQYKSNKE
tara:strand:+ start:102 stop:797 length:696 start_codon:yes stop_codon:yes gene_type:complete